MKEKNRLFYLCIFLLTGICSCVNNPPGEKTAAAHVKVRLGFTPLYLFHDSVHMTMLSLQQDSPDSSEVIVEQSGGNQSADCTRTDKLKTYKLEYDTVDFNNDGTPDLMILKTADQSNPAYYLYIVHTKKDELKYVEGFDTLHTPAFNREHNVVVSYIRSGVQRHYAFYRINNEMKLVDLRKGFSTADEDEADSIYNIKINSIKS